MTGAVASGSVDTIQGRLLRITTAMYCDLTPLCGSSSSFLSLIKGEFLFFIAQITYSLNQVDVVRYRL